MAAPEGYNALGKSEYLTKEITTPIPHMSDWTRLNITAVHIWLLKMLRTSSQG